MKAYSLGLNEKVFQLFQINPRDRQHKFSLQNKFTKGRMIIKITKL